MNPGYTEALHRLYLKNNFYPRRIIQTPIVDTMMLLVESGLGITLLPETSTAVYYPGIPNLYVPRTEPSPAHRSRLAPAKYQPVPTLLSDGRGGRGSRNL